ncbi:MAG: TonB-dependent receptor [bacterium]
MRPRSAASALLLVVTVGCVCGGSARASESCPAPESASDELACGTSSDPLDELECWLKSEEERHYVRAPSRRRERLFRAPTAVTVLTADDIAASGARNLGELFRTVPGLTLTVRSLAETYIDDARGVGTGILAFLPFVEVYLDGRPLRDESLGGTPSFASMPVALEDIERIEVVRGPDTAIYGSGGLNLLIDITTRAPSRAQGTLVHLRGGGPTALGDGVAVQGFELGPIANKLMVSYGYQAELRPDTQNAEGKLVAQLEGDHNDVGEDLFKSSWRAEWDRGSGGRWEAIASYVAGQYDGYVFVPIESRDITDGSVLVRHERDWFAGTTTAQASWEGYTGRAVNQAALTDRDPVDPQGRLFTGSHNLSSELRHEVELDLGCPQDLLVGTSFRWAEGRGEVLARSAEPTIRTVGGYLSDECRLGKSVAIRGGLRAEGLHPAGFELLPSGSIVWEPVEEQQSFRLSVARGVSFPTSYELGGALPVTPLGLPNATPPFDLALLREVSLSVRGDPHAPPPELWAAELGWRGRFPRPRLSASAEVYWERVRNLPGAGSTLDDDGDASPFTFGLPISYDGGYSVVGVEYALDWAALDWLSLAATYGLAYPFDDQNAANRAPGTELGDTIRRHRGSVGLTLDFRKGAIPAPFLRGFSFNVLYQATSDVRNTLPSAFPFLGREIRLDDLVPGLRDFTTVPETRMLNARLAWEAIPCALDVAIAGWNLLDEPLPAWGRGNRIFTGEITLRY